MCKVSRPATGPGSLHHHRCQTDVTVDLQGVNVLKGIETMFKGVCLHPIGHDPEGMTLTTDSQLKDRRGILKSNFLKTLPENSQTKQLLTVYFF